MKFFLLVTSLFIISIIHSKSAFSSDKTTAWELTKEHKVKGVKVYTRYIKGSKAKEFKGVVEIKSTLNDFVTLLRDTENMSNWLTNTKKLTLLKRVNDREIYLYFVNSSPWPTKDRDVIVHIKGKQNPKTLTYYMSMTGLPNYFPKVKGVVRAPYLKGAWIAEPIKNGRLRITYRSHFEPGGYVPHVLVNWFSENMPYMSLLNILEEIKKKKYKNTDAGLIEPTI
jgi:hypothetical protein